MNDLRQAILWYAQCYQGDWTKIAHAIKTRQDYRTIKYPFPFVTYFDKAYPDKLKRLRYPPWILFYRGNLKLFDFPAVGIVGARICTQQAIVNTTTVVHHLKERYCIVSGLAKGIDGAAHQAGLDGHTIGVIGCGINGIYPKVNEHLYRMMSQTQLIVSEYPMDVKPLRHHFPWRNRIIAGSIDRLIVIEATYKSGTMSTVNECLEIGVPVYCLPTAFENKTYPGCNYLIQSGANILSDESELEYI